MLAPLFNIPNYFPDAFLLCVPTHLYVYRPYHIPHLFCEISRATTCDLKCLVTPLAAEKLTGVKCTILGKEHLAPRPFQGAFQVASCSMLCSPWNLSQCVACILWLWNHVLLVFWRAPFVTRPHGVLGFPSHPAISRNPVKPSWGTLLLFSSSFDSFRNCKSRVASEEGSFLPSS